MLHIEIPGRAPMDIANVVFDYNGTIAVDGKMLPELRERIEALLKLVPVYVLTADAYGTVRAQCEPLGMIEASNDKKRVETLVSALFFCL